ncbi:MAG TPA: hypothetical protein DCL54_07935 [Alphaproteobacteria bacterium]|nr:hypothetical protein [Alphaproteobacteria bacterium]HAJ46494.1 hypothetical protein [Alphaproteobacteria bacterium]
MPVSRVVVFALALTGGITEASAGSLPPAEVTKIKAMTGEELMAATAAFDPQLASDLARLSNVESQSSVCGWTALGFDTKRQARMNQIKDDRNKMVAERFYADILAKDITSYNKDKREELCTEDNKSSVTNILADW